MAQRRFFDFCKKGEEDALRLLNVRPAFLLDPVISLSYEVVPKNWTM
jgi:hypothetical protein